MLTQAQVAEVVAVLDGLAEGLCAESRVKDSAAVLMGRQTIRALWTELHPPEPPQPPQPPDTP
jgi:hypothetical protein